MKTLMIKEIAHAISGTLYADSHEGTVTSVSTDSRDTGINGETVFFALTGDNFDGHDFISKVMDKGCRIFVVSKKESICEKSNNCFILVEDTLKAYQDLATYYRDLISPVTIGITGSVGKTSLKDMVNTISCEYFNTVCSFGNENNHIGVPKTIFRMEENTEVLILEMGMSSRGEISLLADIGKPSIAGITNIGLSHIENFADQEEIFHAKMEITENFSKENTLVVSRDDPYLKSVAGNADFRVITAGYSDINDFVVCDAKYLDDKHVTFLIEYDKGIERFTLPVAGIYNGTTAAMASAIMSELDISLANCARALSKLKITPGRLQLLEADGIRIIDDTYNASPASMASAIEYLDFISSERKIAVLADMKELGDMSVTLHREVGAMVARSNIDYLFTIGELGMETGKAVSLQSKRVKVFMFDDKGSCIKKINEIAMEGDVVLVKGSHSMNMEKIVDELLKTGKQKRES